MKYAHIEEETPSYHRRYDFFIDKFAALCHSNHKDLEQRKQLRLSGLKGIKGLIRKIVSDDLQVDLWDNKHMTKILPSLLFNMQNKDLDDVVYGYEQDQRLGELSNSHSDTDSTQVSPKVIAEECLRELFSRATFGHVTTVLKPVFEHFDNHHLWEGSTHEPADKFASYAFKIIMYSIQPQHSYAVVQSLMCHLDYVSNVEVDEVLFENQIRVRTGIVNVLKDIISIPVSAAFGPSMISMVQSLIYHLRDSIVNSNGKYAEQEKSFQDAILNTLGEFTTNIPDYQKIEVMMCIISKVPPPSATLPADIELQNIILNGLLKVTSKYKPSNSVQAFPTSLLNLLLSRALAPDPNVRLTVQKILHQLLDRHNNLPHLLKPFTDKPPEQLVIENRKDRYDISFVKKHVHEILINIFNHVQLASNTSAIFDSIYTTMALICIEVNNEEVLIDLLRLTFAMQDLAINKTASISDQHRCYIHSLVAAFLHLFSHLKAIPAICTHVEQVIKRRNSHAQHLLPEFNCLVATFKGDVVPEPSATSPTRQNSVENVDHHSDQLLFDKNVIAEALQSTGHETATLTVPFLTSNEGNCQIHSLIRFNI